APEWILVSAGFDPHRRDPLGGMGVTEAGFSAMAQKLLVLAERFADARIAFLLEGGYDLTGLRDSVAAVLDAMQQKRGYQRETLDITQNRIQPLLRRIVQVHEKYQ
ncbi:MAG TPA: histone deacetylase, partial [Blastocatellia bacterium]|nr:histone deacetylase [Blastocatellia bacterium]